MRYSTAVCVVGLALAMVACGGTKVNLPPVQPSEVALYYPGMMPEDDYKLLARLSETAPESTSDEDLIAAVRDQAAEMGADALIIDTIRITTEGQVNLDVQQPTEKIIEARAVYYPSRHPEAVAQN